MRTLMRFKSKWFLSKGFRCDRDGMTGIDFIENNLYAGITAGLGFSMLLPPILFLANDLTVAFANGLIPFVGFFLDAF